MWEPVPCGWAVEGQVVAAALVSLDGFEPLSAQVLPLLLELVVLLRLVLLLVVAPTPAPSPPPRTALSTHPLGLTSPKIKKIKIKIEGGVPARAGERGCGCCPPRLAPRRWVLSLWCCWWWRAWSAWSCCCSCSKPEWPHRPASTPSPPRVALLAVASSAPSTASSSPHCMLEAAARPASWLSSICCCAPEVFSGHFFLSFVFFWREQQISGQRVPSVVPHRPPLLVQDGGMLAGSPTLHGTSTQPFFSPPWCWCSPSWCGE